MKHSQKETRNCGKTIQEVQEKGGEKCSGQQRKKIYNHKEKEKLTAEDKGKETLAVFLIILLTLLHLEAFKWKEVLD